MKNLAGTVSDQLFGYDFFISYAQADGKSFAQGLKRALEAKPKPLRCFLDEEGFTVSDELTSATRRHLKRSRRLLLVGSAEAVESSWVQREIADFVALGGDRADHIVPLDVMESIRTLDPSHPIRQAIPFAADPADGASRLLLAIDGAEFHSGPSTATVGQLRRMVGQRRVDSLRARVVQGVVAALAVLVLAMSWLAWQRGLALDEAKQNLATAMLNLAEAERREGRSNRAVSFAAESLATLDTPQARRFLAETVIAPLLTQLDVAAVEASTIAVSTHGLIAIGGADGAVRTYDLQGGKWLEPVAPSPESAGVEVFQLRFDRGGERLAVSRNDGSVGVLVRQGGGGFGALFEAMPPDPRYDEENNPFVWNRVAFDPVGQSLVVAEGSEQIRILGPGGELQQTVALSDTGAGISALVVLGDPARVVVGYFSGEVVQLERADDGAWISTEVRSELSSGETLGGSASLSALAVDPDPRRELAPGDERSRLAAAGNDATVRLIAGDGELLGQVSFPRQATGTPNDNISSVAFSNSGRRLIALRDNGGLGVWRRDGEWALERVVDVQGEGWGGDMACCAGEAIAVTLGPETEDGRRVIGVWDLASTTQRGILQVEGRYAYQDAGVTALDFDASGKTLAVGSSSGHIVVYDVEQHRPLAVLRPPVFENHVTWLGFRPNHSQVASSSHSGLLRLFDWADCEQSVLVTAEDLEMEELYRSAWSPDGRSIVAAPFNLSDESHLWRIDLSGAVPKRDHVAPTHDWVDAIEHLDGDRVATLAAGRAAVVKLSDGSTVPIAAEAEKPFAVVLADGRSPRLLLSREQGVEEVVIGRDGGIESSRMLCRGTDYCSPWQLAVDPNGHWFAASEAGAIWIRRIDDGSLLATLSDHASQIDALAVAPDGRMLAAGTMKGDVLLWDVSAVVDGPDQVVQRVAEMTGLGAGERRPVGPEERPNQRIEPGLLMRWSAADSFAIDLEQDAFLEDSPRMTCDQ